MELEMPSQRNSFASSHASFGMLKWGKTTFGLGLSYIISQRTVCKDNKKADIMTAGLKF